MGELEPHPTNPSHFIGVACKRCGGSLRYLVGRACVPCMLANSKRQQIRRRLAHFPHAKLATGDVTAWMRRGRSEDYSALLAEYGL